MEERKIVEGLMNEKQALQEVVSTVTEELNRYREFGTVEELDEAIAKSTALVEQLEGFNVPEAKQSIKELEMYRVLGPVNRVEESMDKSISLLTEYSSLGGPAEIGEAMSAAQSLLESYRALGTPGEIGAALDMLEDKILTQKCEQIASKFNTKNELVRRMYTTVKDFAVVEELLEESLGKGRTVASPKREIAESRSNSRSGSRASSVVRRVSKQIV